MRVALNATCFNDRPSGARQRFVGIYGELVRLMPNDEFVVYGPCDCDISAWLGKAPNVVWRKTLIPSAGRVRKIATGARYWPGELARERFSIFEQFNLPLVRSGAPDLLTVHDIRNVRDADGALSRRAYHWYTGKSLRAADMVITVSMSMRDEILAVYPDARVKAVYNGINTAAYDALDSSKAQRVRHQLHLPSEFLLAVGHLEPRKNFLRLLEAVALLRSRGRDVSLVIVGNESGEGPAIRRRIEELGLGACVHLLSGLDDHQVRCLYKTCALFVFPSTYEGFGIPMLEAMAARVPMVLSDLAVFREVTEGNAVYADPKDVGQLADAIERGLGDAEYRRRFSVYAVARLEDFTFAKLASQIRDVYRAIA